jgi:hypothetical protein
MEKYISLNALVAELNRLIAELVEEGEDTMFEQGRISAFEDVKVFISHTLEVKEVDFEEGLKTQNKNIWHPMSQTAEHPCAVLMHGYGNDVWIADAVETLEQGAAQEWAYMDDVLTVLGLKAQKGE